MLKRYLVLTFILPLLFASCTQRVYLTVKEPPAVQLNLNYLRGGVVNRTFPKDPDSKLSEVIDKTLTLEGNLDKKGSQAAVEGAFDRLTTNKNLEFITILDSMTAENGGNNVFPRQLAWTEVGNLTADQDLDFLVSLEVYDTDSKIGYSQRTVNQQTPLGNVSVLEHTATLTIYIKTGWRIYDIRTNQIIDEFYMNDKVISSGKGINPVVAASAILNRAQNVKQVSANLGKLYAMRIESQYFRVWRNYFNKGSKNLKIANRRSEVGDWDGAAELWKEDMKSSKRKVAGRAHYNMAIYKEIKGDVYGALELAQKAYADYNIKEAENYSRILRDRIFRIERAQP